jgi:hypothetical protein
MYGAVLDDTLHHPTSPRPIDASRGTAGLDKVEEKFSGRVSDRSTGPRRTPRKSLIVVLPDNHVLSPEVVAKGLPQTDDHDLVDVIVACAGQPANLSAITRRVREVQVLLAPAGTSREDLRELAIREAPGDIVTLLSGAALAAPIREFEMLGGV